MNGGGAHSTGTLVVVAIVAAVVGFVGGYAVAKKQQVEKRDTVIVLSQASPNAPCLPSDPVQLKTKQKQALTWHIRNTCSTALFVKLDNFRARNDDGSLGGQQRIFGEPPTTPSIAANGGTFDLTATLTNDVAQETLFKYEIFLRSSADAQWEMRRDPDIDIWP